MLKRGNVPLEITNGGVAFITFLSSFLLGVTSNLPIPAGPGLGCAAYFAYGLSTFEDSSTSPSFSLTVCFVAGASLTLFSLIDFPARLFVFVPSSVKDAMPVGLGLLLALIGFQQINLVVSDSNTGVAMGDITNKDVLNRILLGCAGTLMMAFLHHKHWKMSFLIPILAITVLSWIVGIEVPPSKFFSLPSFQNFILFSSLSVNALSPIFALFIICLFDIAGVMYGVCKVAGLIKEDGSLPGSYWVFVAAGVGSMIAPLFGCTPIIILGESFAGVIVGGRTGLTAISMGLCFLIAVPLSPLLQSISIVASAPVLIVLGVSLTGLLRFIDFTDMRNALPSFMTIALMPFLYSIDKAIIAGMFTHLIFVLLDFIYDALTCTKKNEELEKIMNSSVPTTPVIQNSSSPYHQSNAINIKDGLRRRSSSNSNYAPLNENYPVNFINTDINNPSSVGNEIAPFHNTPKFESPYIRNFEEKEISERKEMFRRAHSYK